jgi:predicted aspartyl protease
MTEKEGSRTNPMPTLSRRKKPVQQGPTVQDEEGLDCHEKDPTVQDGLDCHEKDPTVQDEEGLDCHEKDPTVQDGLDCHEKDPTVQDGLDCHEKDPTVQDGLDCHEKDPTVQDGLDCHEKDPAVQDEEGLDCHEQVVFDQRRSPKAACWARRKHRQTVRRAEQRRKHWRVSRATLLDDGLEPIHLTNMAQGRRRCCRRRLLDAEIRLNDHEVVALIDSGCDVELVLFRNLADKLRISHALFSREVSLPDGTRMAAARTSTVSLDVAGSRKELTAVVVDMVAFDCILGLHWLGAANPVVNWKTRRHLLSGAEGPVEVDLNHNLCRSRVSDASILSLRLRYSRLVKGAGLLYLDTIRPTSGETTLPTDKDDELSPS